MFQFLTKKKVMSTGLAKIDLRLQRLEETICPITINNVEDVFKQIILKTAEDVINFDLKLACPDFRKELVS